MSAAWAFVREIPLLVWLAILVAVAWVRHHLMTRWTDTRELGSEPRHSGYVVNLTTGDYRKIRCDE